MEETYSVGRPLAVSVAPARGLDPRKGLGPVSSIHADPPEIDSEHAVCWTCGELFHIDSSPNMILCQECDEAVWAETMDGNE